MGGVGLMSAKLCKQTDRWMDESKQPYRDHDKKLSKVVFSNISQFHTPKISGNCVTSLVLISKLPQWMLSHDSQELVRKMLDFITCQYFAYFYLGFHALTK